MHNESPQKKNSDIGGYRDPEAAKNPQAPATIEIGRTAHHQNAIRTQ